MSDSYQVKYFPMGLYRDINEPVICGNNVVFVQNSYSGSKISIYNIKTGKTKSITMKNILCFNIHSDNKNVAFEFSGSRRGAGIICADTLEHMELEDIGTDIRLGGICDNYIILRRNHDIVLIDIFSKKERMLASCHHLFGFPVAGPGSCAWLQVYKGKCCVVFYNIEKSNSLVLSSAGYVNKMFLLDNYLAYQNCTNNKCNIYTYGVNSGELKKIFESTGWVELYKGKDDMLVWTVKKEYQGEYMFDIWLYNTRQETATKVQSDCRNAIIPTASSDVVLWINAKAEGDNIYLMPINF